MAVSAEQRARAERIRDKAQELFGRADIGACESLAELIEWTLNEFHDVYFGSINNDEETFVEDLGLVLTERSESAMFERGDDMDLYLGGFYAMDSCFNPYFQDGSNQVRHFWGYVMLGFQFGRFPADAATLREWFAWPPPEMPDIRLGTYGGRLGAGLDGIGISLDEVADWVRSNICEPGNCRMASGPPPEEED